MQDWQTPWDPESKRAVRIVLADDHDVVRQGLRKLLEDQDHLEVCGEARDGRQAVQLCQKMTASRPPLPEDDA
jgi:CheY-like chemotaxis protein